MYNTERMRTEIISIGDELLIGQTINTNASWLGQQLSKISISVDRVSTVSDSEEEIVRALDEALSKAELVLITGGLGPTKDDITKHTLCRYFGTELVLYPEVLERVESFFKKRRRPMLDVNILQAHLPIDCDIINNNYGTASGMWFERDGKVVVSLPGVPYEMKGIVEDFLLDKIKAYFHTASIYHRTLLTTGIGESYFAELIKSWEDQVRQEGLSLAYLPTPGMLKLRLSSTRGMEDSGRVDAYLKELEEQYPQYVFGYDDQLLTEVIGHLLQSRSKTVGTIESCTGGRIAASFVAVPGSSSYFEGSIVSYSNSVKNSLVGVTLDSLDRYGAVSEEVVVQMAENGAKCLNTSYCIAVSGIAGPDGGSEEKPVGMVWIAVHGEGKTIVDKYYFGNSRENNIQMTTFAGLNMLRKMLINIES